jgi:hypothetical protein
VAERDPPQPHVASAVGAGQHPAAGDAIVLGDLVDDLEREIVESARYSAVDWRTPSSPWYSALAK